MSTHTTIPTHGYSPAPVATPVLACLVAAGIWDLPVPLAVSVLVPVVGLITRWARFTEELEGAGHPDPGRLVADLTATPLALDPPTLASIRNLLCFERASWSAVAALTVLVCSWAHAQGLPQVGAMVIAAGVIATGAGLQAYWTRTTATIAWIDRRLDDRADLNV